MGLNISKCKFITYQSIKNIVTFLYSISNLKPFTVSKIEGLGIIFDLKLTFNMHI